MNKTALIIAIILIALIATTVLWETVFSSILEPASIEPVAIIQQPDLAETLCTDPETADCCRESAQTIEDNEFILADGMTCPDDLTLGQLRCIGSLRWCEAN